MLLFVILFFTLTQVTPMPKSINATIPNVHVPHVLFLTALAKTTVCHALVPHVQVVSD